MAQANTSAVEPPSQFAPKSVEASDAAQQVGKKKSQRWSTAKPEAQIRNSVV
jgi:hypothetical protein